MAITTAGGSRTSGSTNRAGPTDEIYGAPASAQKAGGVLKLSHFDSPASMSILEESTRAALQPMMGVFNNLVMYDHHVVLNSLESIVPDLATSWSWSEDGTELIFLLRAFTNALAAAMETLSEKLTCNNSTPARSTSLAVQRSNAASCGPDRPRGRGHEWRKSRDAAEILAAGLGLTGYGTVAALGEADRSAT